MLYVISSENKIKNIFHNSFNHNIITQNFLKVYTIRNIYFKNYSMNNIRE